MKRLHWLAMIVALIGFVGCNNTETPENETPASNVNVQDGEPITPPGDGDSTEGESTEGESTEGETGGAAEAPETGGAAEAPETGGAAEAPETTDGGN
ncbi:MAG: hypothetical protein KDA83_21425 [Planctomycetales bacterium]|nr:hypothetical protein [Planctomycetales bacterium]